MLGGFGFFIGFTEANDVRTVEDLVREGLCCLILIQGTYKKNVVPYPEPKTVFSRACVEFNLGLTTLVGNRWVANLTPKLKFG